MRLTHKIALITGASRGIGASVASGGVHALLRYGVLLASFFLLSYTVYMSLFVYNMDIPNSNVDEPAHIEYALYLIKHHCWWVDFNNFPIVHQNDFFPPGVPKNHLTQNYLNHPPTFYWMAKAIHALIPSLPLLKYRVMSYILLLVSMGIYARIGARCVNNLLPATWFAALPFLFYFKFLTGFFSNDSACFLGGMLSVAASLRWFQGECPRSSYAIMLVGLALASVKLTSFLLVGSYVLMCLTFNPSRDQLKLFQWLCGALVVAILTLPYLKLIILYGSPAPETVGRMQLVYPPKTLGSAAPGMRWEFLAHRGWIQHHPFDFFDFTVTFLTDFADQISMPEITFLPLLVISASLLFFLIRPSPMRSLALVTMFATILTLAIHIAFTWRQYLQSGHMDGAFVRYYFPLLGAYGLLSAKAIDRISSIRFRHDTPNP